MNYKEYIARLNDFHNSIREGFELSKNIRLLSNDFDKIAFVGVGDSSMTGKIMANLYGDHLDIFDINSYHLPSFFDSKTLVFLISYSGNAEEVMFAMKDGLRLNCKMIAITSGGKLSEIAKKDNITLVNLPKNLVPNISLGYVFFSVLRILSNHKIIQDVSPEIDALVNVFKNKKKDSLAGNLSEKIYDKTVIVYTPENLNSVGYRWKTQFNEVSKINSFSNILPDLDHNEIMSYSFENPDYYVIFLTDEKSGIRMKKRVEITKDIIKRSASVTEIQIRGNSLLAKIFTAINLGDLTAADLALKRKVDPLSVDLYDEINSRLKKDFIFF